MGLPEINTSYSLHPTTCHVSFLHPACYSPTPRASRVGWSWESRMKVLVARKAQAPPAWGGSPVLGPEGGWERPGSGSWTLGVDLRLERAGLRGRVDFGDQPGVGGITAEGLCLLEAQQQMPQGGDEVPD